MTSPRELSRDLLLRTDPDLRRRRWLVGLSLLGVAMGQIVALFQTGIVRRLPDPPVETPRTTPRSACKCRTPS